MRNDEWEFQVFMADAKPNNNANRTACFQCHKSQMSKDFLFTFDKIKAAAAR